MSRPCLRVRTTVISNTSVFEIEKEQYAKDHIKSNILMSLDVLVSGKKSPGKINIVGESFEPLTRFVVENKHTLESRTYSELVLVAVWINLNVDPILPLGDGHSSMFLTFTQARPDYCDLLLL